MNNATMNKAAELCMKNVPIDTIEYEYDSCAEYNISNYKTIIKQNLYKYIGNHKIRFPVSEIAEYICNLDYDHKFNIHSKAGILFFYNGFSLLGFTNKNQSTVPLINNKILLIDVNNYIFNKEFSKKSECRYQFLEYLDKISNIALKIFICGLLYVLVLYILFIINTKVE